ncbi:DUF924 domain-containing protein [Duganella sp. BJB488]|uniref:DUF924 family protein n=1 Tax=unclassified Duganella TaxID=2636909 RepID=UPI000E344A39|nr:MULTISPECIES: DUF924 family protein [unclassified Duganella]RFP24365.1 DUF924 domain-containing protein [Duganella sp. BJB489]RFP26725.1 DUF924 domain-containing protein [Duganella sp. BJB488]RFP34542.1 DUF924 domain-containing protein [Duganella sp. BJB480]
MNMNVQAKAVFDFWFQPSEGQAADAPRREWFQKNDDFDREIAGRFGALIEQALAGDLRHWDMEGPRSALARIVVLDQFCRNVHRGTPLALAGDPQALQAALAMVDARQDEMLTPLQRGFVYLPFEHAEDMAMQERAVALFERMHDAEPTTPGLAGMLDFARRHREVIKRFGRFPHRNAILGRASTPEEQAYLLQPGSGF